MGKREKTPYGKVLLSCNSQIIILSVPMKILINSLLLALVFISGHVYADSFNTPVDINMPNELSELQKLSDQGHADAQFRLGVMYNFGIIGAPKDYAQALHWFRKAAEQGYEEAQYNLGVMYMQGKGVPKDDAQAVYWHQKAAEQGNAGSQLHLGIMYGLGTGIPKDEETAYFWFLLSSAQGNEEAVKSRDLIEKIITLQQRANAQAAARVWKPKEN